MNEELTPKATINNEYDYSNALPTVEAITFLIQYCDNVYKNLIKKVLDDEEKNKQFKEQYKEYMYKKSYSQRFEVSIYEPGFNNITCKDYEEFLSAVKGGNLKKVNILRITMNLDFDRGKSENIERHENEFNITFKPYEITFIRKSNHDDPSMNNIENQIKEILNKFPVVNTIFCSK